MLRPLPAGLLWALFGALLSGLLLKGCERPVPAPGPVKVDTVAAAQYEQRQASLVKATASPDGVAARLAGAERRAPKTVTVYDTVISLVQDTVVLGLQTSGSGVLTLDVAVPDSAGHRPQTLRGIDLSDCDDGLTVRATSVVCNRARLGHLSLIARAGIAHDPFSGAVSPGLEAGFRWEPSFRSTWAAELTADQEGRVRFVVQKGLRLF